ncbi:MAG: ATP phosphoribosyltransferase [Chloroflexi bacterium]|nr:ATP phosphoribosyltransferase [Chloroflexota bacterium]
MNNLKAALPKGRLLEKTAALLNGAGWGMDGYTKEARLYAMQSSSYPEFTGKMFHEKDIAVQVAAGNYDMGVCGLDWVNEYLTRHPNCDIVKAADFAYGYGTLYAAASAKSGFKNEEDLQAFIGNFRIASEYPSLAEGVAERLRLKLFSIYPLWGSADAYPPENAELAVIPAKNSQALAELGLLPVFTVLEYHACLIINKKSLQGKDLSALLQPLLKAAKDMAVEEKTLDKPVVSVQGRVWEEKGGELKMALPDGHQQPHVKRIFDAAGIEMINYPAVGERRPSSPVYNNTLFKLIRPQDMTFQVANGSFDIAITGRDWLIAHKLNFPNSPVRELLDLKYGWVRIVAAVHNDVPVETSEELAAYFRNKGVRICSEYTAVADDYASRMRFGNYRIIPTWGATEAFLPDDADVMVENTETGGTIKRNNLKIIETIFESTACIIANEASLKSPDKKAMIDDIVGRLKIALEKENEYKQN